MVICIINYDSNLGIRCVTRANTAEFSLVITICIIKY